MDAPIGRFFFEKDEGALINDYAKEHIFTFYIYKIQIKGNGILVSYIKHSINRFH